MQGWEADRLVEFLVRDITDGIQGTDIKAGIIKAATDHLGVTDLNKKTLQVAARLHRATGVPISTHTSVAHRTGLGQQDVFEEEGVDLSRVVIGHCGDTEDLDYLEAIMARGSFIGMDRFGLDMILPGEKRVATIAALCERGRADRMVLSPRRLLPHRLVPQGDGARHGTALELPPHPRRGGAGAPQGGRLGRAHPRHDGRQPAPRLRGAGRLLVVGPPAGEARRHHRLRSAPCGRLRRPLLARFRSPPRCARLSALAFSSRAWSLS